MFKETHDGWYRWFGVAGNRSFGAEPERNYDNHSPGSCAGHRI